MNLTNPDHQVAGILLAASAVALVIMLTRWISAARRAHHGIEDVPPRAAHGHCGQCGPITVDLDPAQPAEPQVIAAAAAHMATHSGVDRIEAYANEQGPYDVEKEGGL